MGILGLLSKSGLDLVINEPTSKIRSYYIEDSRRTSFEGRRSYEIRHISKISNGSTEWRAGSIVYIG